MIETSIYIGDIKAHQGSRKPVHLSVPGNTFQTSVAKVIDNVECDLIVENVSQGFVVHGSIAGSYSAQCSYGLVDLVDSFSTNVNELFEEKKHAKFEPVNAGDDTYFYSGEEIDIEELLQDSIVVALPIAPKCSHGPENCAVCSNEIVPHLDKTPPGVIGGVEDVFGAKDERWSVLDELKLDE